MSTVQLCSALRLAEAGDEAGTTPSPRLLRRLQDEWDERPLQDRVVASAALRAGEKDGAGGAESA